MNVYCDSCRETKASDQLFCLSLKICAYDNLMMPLAFAGAAAHFVARWRTLLLLLDLATASASGGAAGAAIGHMGKSCKILERLALLHELTRHLVLRGVRLVD